MQKSNISVHILDQKQLASVIGGRRSFAYHAGDALGSFVGQLYRGLKNG